MAIEKLRVTQDYEKLSDEYKEQIKLVYPEGYIQHLIRFRNKKGENVSSLRFETADKIYLVRMSIQEAREIVHEDSDYDNNGKLKDEARSEYEDKYSDVEYLSDNENYDE
jgi:hypothetical protein